MKKIMELSELSELNENITLWGARTPPAPAVIILVCRAERPAFPRCKYPTCVNRHVSTVYLHDSYVYTDAHLNNRKQKSKHERWLLCISRNSYI